MATTIFLLIQHDKDVQRGVSILTGKEHVDEGTTVQFSFAKVDFPDYNPCADCCCYSYVYYSCSDDYDNNDCIDPCVNTMAKYCFCLPCRVKNAGDGAVLQHLARALETSSVPIHIRFLYCNIHTAAMTQLYNALRKNVSLVGFSEFGNPGSNASERVRAMTATLAPVRIFQNGPLPLPMTETRLKRGPASPDGMNRSGSTVKRHFAFISYAKTDALSETKIVAEYVAHKFPGKSLFRDTDQHFALSDLIDNVSASSNVLVFLTPNYTNRPFCLIEMHHAIKGGVNIVTITIRKPGLAMFDFEALNAALSSENTLKDYIDSTVWDVLATNGVSVEDIRSDLRKIINVKAFTLDMDQSKRVQDACLEDIVEGLH